MSSSRSLAALFRRQCDDGNKAVQCNTDQCHPLRFRQSWRSLVCDYLWEIGTLHTQDTEQGRKENTFEYFTSCAKSHSGPRLLQLIRRSECGEWGVLSSVISNSPNFISHIISNIAGEHIFHQSFFVNV